MNWFDEEEERLVDAVNAGEISESEYRAAMFDLRREYEQCRQDAAQEACDNYGY